jgi:hypothetical protein
LLAPTLAALLCPDSIHSPDIRQPFSPDSIHSPDIRQPFFSIFFFEKNVTRLNTFARVIRHFGEFGASGHCLLFTQKFTPSNYYYFFGFIQTSVCMSNNRTTVKVILLFISNVFVVDFCLCDLISFH